MSKTKNFVIDEMNKQPIFLFRAVVCGGRGPTVWDKEIEVSGPNMTFREALEAVERQIDTLDAAIVSLEQID